MKKILILLLSALMILIASACGAKNDGLEDINQKNTIKIQGIEDGDNSLKKIKLGERIELSMESEDIYRYDYMGMEFQFTKEINKMIDNGSLFFQSLSLIGNDDDPEALEYGFLYLNYIPEDLRNQEFLTANEQKEWLAKTTRIATIGVFSKNSSENILDITGCKEESLIASSEDELYNYYIATNSSTEVNTDKIIEENTFNTFDIAKIDLNTFGSITLPARNKGISNIGDFNTVDLDGNAVTPEIFKDYDLNMVNLWSTTCGYCLDEMPYLEEIRSKMQADGKSFNIVGIVMDVNRDGVINEDMLEEAKELVDLTEYQTLIPDNILNDGRLKGVCLFPETFFVDRDGNIVSEAYSGANSKDDWQKIIDKELSDVTEK